MITRNAVDEDFLAEVVTRITGVLRPWRIILFGSRARGSASDDSDYDFYVEVDATGDDALRDAHDRIQPHWSVTLTPSTSRSTVRALWRIGATIPGPWNGTWLAKGACC